MRFFSHILVVLLAPVLSLGCQAATVTGPGWGEAPLGPGVGGPGVAGEPGADPEQVFLEQVLPLLDARCNNCHTDGVTAPLFLDPADPYDTFLASGVIAIGDPGGSEIITKGAHRGPAWDAAEAQVVSDWITLEGGVTPGGGGVVDPGEGEAGGEETPPPPPVAGDYETTPLQIVVGDNQIDLDDVGLAGGEVRFFAQRVALGMHISSVTIYAGAEGLAISHPTLIIHDPDNGSQADPEDRFATVELVVPADGAALLADNVLLTDFPINGSLSISFTSTSTLF